MKSELDQQHKDEVPQKPYSDLRTSLSELDRRFELLRKQRQAWIVNDIARIRNESAIHNEDPLEPLLNVHDGLPIQGFPKTLGDFLKFESEEVLACLEAFFNMTNARKQPLNRTRDMQNRRMLATAIGINVSISSKLA